MERWEEAVRDLRLNVEREVMAQIAGCLAAVRPALVLMLESRLAEFCNQQALASSRDGEWHEIDSLTKLRGVVGGRLENLRARWTASGFPLKAHRGDTDLRYDLAPAGWSDLSNWLEKQGFEAVLAPAGSKHFFKTKKRT